MYRRLLIPLLLLTLSHQLFGASAELYSKTPEKTGTQPRWAKRIVTIALSNSLRQMERGGVSTDEAEHAVQAALEAWERVSGLVFRTYWTDAEEVSGAPGRTDRVSLITVAPSAGNLLMFAGSSIDDIARTRLFTDRRGFISEADIALNPYGRFSTDGTIGTFDLQSVLTHEIGHLLGLSHSPVLGATMCGRMVKNGTLGRGGFPMRTLSTDDTVAVRAVYGSDSEHCYGSVAGVIATAGASAVVWLEEGSTGRTVSGKFVGDGGKFLFEGLDEGEYVLRVDVGGVDRQNAALGAPMPGWPVTVTRFSKVEVRPQVRFSNLGFGSPMLGHDGQFAQAALQLAPGETTGVLIGLYGVQSGVPKVVATSPFIRVLGLQIFGGGLIAGASVVGLDIGVERTIPAGEYTLRLVDEHGIGRSLIGALTVESDAVSREEF